MPIVREIKASDTFVVATPGLAYRLGMRIDAFFETAGLADASKVIITDPSNKLCLGGVTPDYPSFKELIEGLKLEIANAAPRRLVVTGTSAGGHTALLLGHLLNADHVVSFSPYPYLSKAESVRMRDPAIELMYRRERVAEEWARLPEDVQQLVDLKNVLVNWNGKTEYSVHVSRYNKADYKRAKYLVGMPHLKVFSHPFGVHSISSILSARGHLSQCFEFPYRREVRPTDLYFHLKYFVKQIISGFVSKKRRRIRITKFA